MEKGEEFLKNIQPRKTMLFVGLWFLLMFAGAAVSAYVKINDQMKSPVDMADVNKENVYSCFEAQFAIGPIAEYTNKNNQKLNDYILMDDEHLILASISAKLEDELKDVIEYTYSEEEPEVAPDPVKICGGTSSITSDFKKLAVDGYNTAFDFDLKLTDANKVFGYYYIDTSKTLWEQASVELVAGGVIGVFGLLLVGIYLVNVKKTKKNLKKYENEMDKIKMSVSAPDTYYDKKAKVYLTNDYLINFAAGFDIYDYKDIVWIYPHEMRQNGYVSQKSIYVITSDSKAHIISNLSASKKNSIKVDELYQSMLIKLPDVLHGYTEENKKKAKERYKK